jgi:hypothetical protein
MHDRICYWRDKFGYVIGDGAFGTRDASRLIAHRPFEKATLRDLPIAQYDRGKVPTIGLDTVIGLLDGFCWTFESLKEPATSNDQKACDVHHLILPARHSQYPIKLLF